MNDIKITGLVTSGDLGYTDGRKTAQHNLNCNGNVTIKDCRFGMDGYNAVNIGTAQYLAKNVIVENCQFTGRLTNNAISVYNNTENATITLKNCYFKECSNVLRVCNQAKGKLTINLINCIVDQWATEGVGFNGFMLLEDLIKTDDDIRFGPDLVTINFIDCYYPDNEHIDPELRGKKIMPENVKDICFYKVDGDIDPEQQSRQVVYVYKHGLNKNIEYDPAVYPKMTFA